MIRSDTTTPHSARRDTDTYGIAGRTLVAVVGTLFLLAFGASTLSLAQPATEVYDDFEDNDVSEYFTFAGETGVTLGTGTEVPAQNGGTAALTADFAAGDGSQGGFIGGFGKNDINVDLSAFSLPRLNFYYKFNAGSPETAFTLEVNIQEDEDGDGAYDPNVDDEFRLFIRVQGESQYTPASAEIERMLLNQNGQSGGDGVFNGTVAGVVFAISEATPDNGAGDAEGGQLVVDYISFSDGDPIEPEPPLGTLTTFDDMEDDDVSEYFTFAGETGVSLGTSGDTPRQNGGDVALTADFASGDGSQGGFIGGFGKNDINADLSGFASPRLNFYYKFNAGSPGTSFVLEANVQEDEDGDGSYDPNVDDEFRLKLRVPGSSSYGLASVEIDALQRNQNGQAGGDGRFNGTVAGVVFSITSATPDDGVGDPEGGQLLIDAISFTSDGPLPVELSGFDVRLDGRDAVLSWQTLSETNNAGFDVQVARSGGFRTVGLVKGAGTTSEVQQYRYRVSDLDPGSYEFRLRQVDLDGSSSLSDVVTVSVGAQSPFVILQHTPNPVRSGQTVRLKYLVAERERVTVQLYNLLGQRIQTLASGMSHPDTPSTATFSTQALASGVYFVRFEGRSFSRTEKLTVVR